MPVHLFTREALAVYRKRLRPTGLLAYHISNRYLDITPVLAALAHDAGLTCASASDPGDPKEGRFPSDWVVMGGPSSGIHELLTRSATWQELPGRPGQPLWRDDFSNILGLLR
jgi:hypothetical protein